MKILMRTMAAGVNGNMYPDKIYLVEDSLGKDLVEGKYATEVDDKGRPIEQEEILDITKIEEFIPEVEETVNLDEEKPRIVPRTKKV